MSAIERNPLSVDLAAPQNWMFVLKRAPSLQYFCNSVKLPDIMMVPVKRNEPNLMVPFEGDHIIYTPIELTFNVDINFQNWQEILNWMRGLLSPTGNTSVYQSLETNQASVMSPYTKYSDMSVIQLDSQQNPLMTWTFKRAFPIALSGPRFDSKALEDLPYMVSTCAIQFTTFSIETNT